MSLPAWSRAREYGRAMSVITLNPATDLDHLLDRAGELKGELVTYGLNRRWDRAREAALRDGHSGGGLDAESDAIDAIDRFLLEHRLPDGRTVLARFVAARGDLARSERDLLLGWHDVVEGMFEVERRDGQTLIAINVIDELTYTICSTVGGGVFDVFDAGSVLVGRLVPLGDVWLVTGSTRCYGPEARQHLYPIAAQHAMRNPELCFRNPDKLAQAREISAAHRRQFIDHFGADCVVLPGVEVCEQLNAYWRAVNIATGQSDPRDLPLIDADGGLGAAETVGIIHDEGEGLSLFAEFGRLRDIYADPASLACPQSRDFVMSYLRDPTVSPLALRRLGAQFPTGADAVLSRVLNRPGFSWERDGERLMGRMKPAYADAKPLPKIAPLGERLTRYL